MERWVGRPFDAEDRDPGCHCWGLVRRVLAAERGIAVPAYAETSAADLVAISRHMTRRAGASWLPAERPRAFDVVLMAGGTGEVRRAPVHCGILVTEGHVLHVERMTDSVAVPLGHWSVAARVIGYFRHEALA